MQDKAGWPEVASNLTLRGTAPLSTCAASPFILATAVLTNDPLLDHLQMDNNRSYITASNWA